MQKILKKWKGEVTSFSFNEYFTHMFTWLSSNDRYRLLSNLNDK